MILLTMLAIRTIPYYTIPTISYILCHAYYAIPTIPYILNDTYYTYVDNPLIHKPR